MEGLPIAATVASIGRGATTLLEQPASSSTTPLPDLLFVDTDPAVANCLPALLRQHRITVADGAGAALRALERTVPAIVITELDLRNGRGEEVCRRAKQLIPTPSVLVTTTSVERVPVALVAGCDGVLLKPFAPNLLYARIGRLLRARSVDIRMRSVQHLAKSAHLVERAAQLSVGTNHVWSSTHCPYCAHTGIVNFDHAVHRREWFACLTCQKVWMAKSPEHLPDGEVVMSRIEPR
jgi:DNA-binding response OmpR family regulator